MPVGAQELLLVEHRRQHPPELGLVENRRQPPTRVTDFARGMDERRQLRACREERAQALGQLRMLLQEDPVEDGHRTQGEQPHHGADFQPLGPTAG